MKRRIVINGRFLTQPVTGVQRYGREIVSALKVLCRTRPELFGEYHFEILTPLGIRERTFAANITQRAVGRFSGHMWEQIELPRYAKRDLLLNFANTAPIRVRNQIVTIHDASVIAAPSGYSPSFRVWYRYLHKTLCRKTSHIVTDSNFSQSELERYCGLQQARSTVIALGAEHVLREPPDQTILNQLNIDGKKFVLCASSLNPNKNLAALIETAHRLRERGFPLVVAGGGNQRVFQRASIDFPDNVKYTGYVTDAQLRGLYESAACFVFPSRYEGFGLPPLEAMRCGCPVVSSNAASLPEVCGSAAILCDPSQPGEFAEAVSVVLDDASRSAKLSATGKAHADNFRWEKAARQWLDVIDAFLS